MSLFYKTLNISERQGDHNCPSVVSRGDWEEAVEESWRVSASLPLPLAPLRALEVRVSKQWPAVATVTRARCSAWSHHRRRRSPSHPDILHSGFKYRGVKENWKRHDFVVNSIYTTHSPSPGANGRCQSRCQRLPGAEDVSTKNVDRK